MTTERKFKGKYFIIGLLFTWAAIIAFQNPADDIAALVMFASVLAIVKGSLGFFDRNKDTDIKNKPAHMLISIIDLLIGIFFLFHLALGMIVSPFIFAIWFICDSVGHLINQDVAKKISESYYRFSLVINILGVIIGVMLFFNPLVSALTLAFLIGFYLLLTGINYLIAAF
ncbi:HdeD family acid-resistance protein [Enterococcus ureasiticus]|nr:DUF308 domain-containing protein [Enterococcus ureasiticus]